MLSKRTQLLFFVFSGTLFLSGCFASIYNAPLANTAQINAALQNPARVTQKVVDGGLVSTFNLDDGQYVNLQINKYQRPSNSHAYSAKDFGYEHTLTIGHFSKMLGSGFSKKSNIFYKKKIRSSGQDTFQLGVDTFRITWYLIDARYYNVYEVVIDKPEEAKRYQK